MRKVDEFTLVTHVVRKGDGQGRVNYEVVKEALRRGIRLTLVASEISPELVGHPLVEWFPVSTRGLPASLIKERWFAVRSASILRRHRKGPLVTNGCITTVPADLNACHFVHGSWKSSAVHPGRIRGGLVGAYYLTYTSLNARWEKAAYLQARRIVSVSEQVRQELIQFGIDGSKITTVHNGVDADEFAPRPADRTKFGLPLDVPLALFAGDLRSPRKNLDTVLKAMREEPRLHLAVAGWLESSPYPRMAEELGVSDRVVFLGNVREMPLLMSSCDVFAFPSRYEACSLVMLEAMAAGLPVITSRTTGGAELVPPDGGFVLDSPEDVSGMAGILRRVCSGEVDLRRMSDNARRQGLGLRWDAMGQRYIELLEKQ